MFKYPFLFGKDKNEPEGKTGKTAPTYGKEEVSFKVNIC